MPIYTRAGDSGESDLVGGVRVTKDAAVLEACGTLDELSSWLGMARCQSLPAELAALLATVQRRLLDVGQAIVAAASGQAMSPTIDPREVTALEALIDDYDARLPKLTTFILPDGTPTAATLHVARTVCRRAERRMVALMPTLPRSEAATTLAYLNRLSDLLFVAARLANANAGRDNEKR